MIFLLKQQRISIFILLFCSSFCFTAAEQISPCHDFVDHVCSKSNPTPAPKLPYHGRELFPVVEQRQEYVFPNEAKNRSLLEVVVPAVISKWLVEYQTILNGNKWQSYNQSHENFLKLTQSQQNTEIINVLNNFIKIKPHIAQTMFDTFYISLKNAVKYFKGSKKPTSNKNPYYHGIWKDVFSVLSKNIIERSKFTTEQRETLHKQLNSTKVYFPFFDFNNVVIWEKATFEYERAYHRLKSQISEEGLKLPHSERILRIGALSPSVAVLKEYMKEFSERFIFQSVNGMLKPDSFNYLQEVVISVLPKTDPMVLESVMTDVVFVMGHELMHSVYNLERHPFESDIWKKEEDCILKKVETFSMTDTNDVRKTVDHRLFIHEDIANLEGIRTMMELAAQRSYNDQQLRDTLEYFINGYCQLTRTKLEFHNSVGVSFNAAISQLPNFHTLYNCSAGDRMYTEPSEICETMAVPQVVESYELQKIGNADLEVLSVSLNNLEELAAEIDNGTYVYEVEVVQAQSQSSLSSSEASKEDDEEELEEMIGEVPAEGEGSAELPTVEDEYPEEISSNQTFPVPMADSFCRSKLFHLATIILLIIVHWHFL